MKKNKLFMAIATLFLVMVFTVAGGTTSEAAKKKSFYSGDLYYRTISDKQVEVRETKKTSGTLTIPAYVTYKGKKYKVTKIANPYKDSGFGLLYESKIKKVVLPSTLTYIEDFAFADSRKLQEVVFAKKYKKLTIGENAFAYNSKMKKISFPEGTYELKANVAKEVPEIYIPSTVKKIGVGVVDYNTKKVTISKRNKKFKMKDGILYSRDEKKLISASAKVKKNVKISSKTKSIGKKAFYSTGIKSIALNKNITKIPEGAFWCCNKLVKVTNAENIKTIEKDGFASCSRLYDVGNLTNLTTIGEEAFAFDEKLTITISSKMNVHNHAFGSNDFSDIGTNAPTVKVAENDTVYSIENGLLIKKDGTEQIVMLQTEELEEITVPEGTTYIETSLGSESLKKITFPASVKEINGGISMKRTMGENSQYTGNEGEMYFKGVTPPKFASVYAFKSVKNVYVPKGTVEAYKQAVKDAGGKSAVAILRKITFIEY